MAFWPNDVWYEYFTSKGFGLVFLSMLLTDDLASQTVTFCFFSPPPVSGEFVREATQDWRGILASVVYLLVTSSRTRDGALPVHHLPAGSFLMPPPGSRAAPLRRAFDPAAPVSSSTSWFWPAAWSIPTSSQCSTAADCRHGSLAPRSAPPAHSGLRGRPSDRELCRARPPLLHHLPRYGMFTNNPMRLMWRWADQERFSHWWSPYLPVT